MVRVVQITDLHLTTDSGSKLYDVDTGFTLGRVISRINQLTVQPDIVIATGDLVEDPSRAAYIRLRGYLFKLNCPVYVLPGNHDHTDNMRKWLINDGIHFDTRSSIGKWEFVFVNSQVVGKDHGCVSVDELAVLERNCSACGEKPILVSIHHTPDLTCPCSGCQLENSAELIEVLSRYENVKGVIAGHTHLERQSRISPFPIFTTPSTFAHVTHDQSGKWKDHEDFWMSHELNIHKQGFRSLDLMPDGEITSQVYWIND